MLTRRFWLAQARLCAARAGQPNVTLLPGPEGGITILLLAPNATARGVMLLLKKRNAQRGADASAHTMRAPTARAAGAVCAGIPGGGPGRKSALLWYATRHSYPKCFAVF